MKAALRHLLVALVLILVPLAVGPSGTASAEEGAPEEIIPIYSDDYYGVPQVGITVVGGMKFGTAEWHASGKLIDEYAREQVIQSYGGEAAEEVTFILHCYAEEGTIFSVEALPAEGYRFIGWGTANPDNPPYSTNPSCTFTVQGYTFFCAYFEPIDSNMKQCFIYRQASSNAFEYYYPYPILRGESYVLPGYGVDSCGWRVQTGGREFIGYPGDVIVVEDDVVLRPIPDSLRESLMYFYANGGTGAMQAMVVPGYAYPTMPYCEFENGDLLFAGWVTYGGMVLQPGEQYWIHDGGEKPLVYATWKERPADTYVLTIKSDGGNRNFRVFGKAKGAYQAVMRPGDPFTLSISAEYGYTIEGIHAVGMDIPESVVSDGSEPTLTMPANDVTVTVSVSPVKFAVSFNPHGGTGTMDDLMVGYHEKASLPGCGFTPPPGKRFSAWAVLREDHVVASFEPGYELEVDDKLTLYAIWEDEPDCSHSSLVKVDAVAATCETPGSEAYWKCSACGKLFTDAEGAREIAAPAEIPAGHDWGEWTVTKEPTVTTEGEKTRVCKRDASHVETEAIPVVTTPGDYVPAYGSGQTWSADDEEGLLFIIKRELDDDTTYSHFMGASVDGVAVPPLGYDAAPGSLELTLKPAYLATLAPGKHTLTVTFDDGRVDVPFETAEASGGIEPTPSPEPGDRSGLPAWAWILIGLGGVAIVAFAVLTVLRLRAKKEAAALRASHHISHEHAGSTPTRRR